MDGCGPWPRKYAQLEYRLCDDCITSSGDIRKKTLSEKRKLSSRIAHFLFFAGLGAPLIVAFFYSGLTHLDGLVGLGPLPRKTLFLIAGVVLALPGLYLMGASNVSLRTVGSGANAFRLTRRIVAQDVYRYTRNPMSLGYYLLALSIAFLSGSTLLALYVLLGLIPAHLFFLKFFEERELELRFGEPYKQYRQKVSFMIPKWSANE